MAREATPHMSSSVCTYSSQATSPQSSSRGETPIALYPAMPPLGMAHKTLPSETTPLHWASSAFEKLHLPPLDFSRLRNVGSGALSVPARTQPAVELAGPCKDVVAAAVASARSIREAQPLPAALQMPLFSNAARRDAKLRGRHAAPEAQAHLQPAGPHLPARKRIAVGADGEMDAQALSPMEALPPRTEAALAADSFSGQAAPRRVPHRAAAAAQVDPDRRPHPPPGAAGDADVIGRDDEESAVPRDTRTRHVGSGPRQTTFVGAVKLPRHLQARVDELRSDEAAAEAFEEHMAAVLREVAPPSKPSFTRQPPTIDDANPARRAARLQLHFAERRRRESEAKARRAAGAVAAVRRGTAHPPSLSSLHSMGSLQAQMDDSGAINAAVEHTAEDVGGAPPAPACDGATDATAAPGTATVQTPSTHRSHRHSRDGQRGIATSLSPEERAAYLKEVRGNAKAAAKAPSPEAEQGAAASIFGGVAPTTAASASHRQRRRELAKLISGL